MIACLNLGLDYPDGLQKRTVLNGINLRIKRGENVVLQGPSGCGKSSLIYLLSTLRKPTRGEILLHSENLFSLNERKLAEIRRKRFGFIFQMHFLLPYLNVSQNVILGANSGHRDAQKQAASLLQSLGLQKHSHKKPHQLSAGQRQRVAIARALMNDPDVIFADEPTASLDHNTALEVMEVIKAHKKSKAILIMATHDTSILAGDERVIDLTYGTITECI